MDVVLRGRLSILALDATHIGKSVMVLGILFARSCISPQVSSDDVALVLLSRGGQLVNAVKRTLNGDARSVLAILAYIGASEGIGRITCAPCGRCLGPHELALVLRRVGHGGLPSVIGRLYGSIRNRILVGG